MSMDEIIEFCEQEGMTVEDFFRYYIDVIDINDCYD